jgi:hypothetical protein
MILPFSIPITSFTKGTFYMIRLRPLLFASTLVVSSLGACAPAPVSVQVQAPLPPAPPQYYHPAPPPPPYYRPAPPPPQYAPPPPRPPQYAPPPPRPPYYHPAPPPPPPPSDDRWHQGDRFQGTRSVVPNWRAYNLPQPGQGYVWLRNGHQFLLVGPDGVIARTWRGD